MDVNALSVGLTFDSVSLGTGTHKVKGVIAATGLPPGVTLVEEDVEVEIEITGTADGDAGDGDTSDDGSAAESGDGV